MVNSFAVVQVIQYMDSMDEVAVDLTNLIASSRDEHDVVSDLNDILFRWSMECT